MNSAAVICGSSPWRGKLRINWYRPSGGRSPDAAVYLVRDRYSGQFVQTVPINDPTGSQGIGKVLQVRENLLPAGRCPQHPLAPERGNDRPAAGSLLQQPGDLSLDAFEVRVPGHPGYRFASGASCAHKSSLPGRGPQSQLSPAPERSLPAALPRANDHLRQETPDRRPVQERHPPMPL